MSEPYRMTGAANGQPLATQAARQASASVRLLFPSLLTRRLPRSVLRSAPPVAA